ncbi:MAG: hypothetical protein Q8R82_02135 [Hyphomonadaceae bacterium]|nr:hypothetical protein [Hyphomonadaceae bacterium]
MVADDEAAFEHAKAALAADTLEPVRRYVDTMRRLRSVARDASTDADRRAEALGLAAGLSCRILASLKLSDLAA